MNADGNDAKGPKGHKGARGSIFDLHFSFSCSAVLAQNTYAEKLTVMFYVEVVGGQ